MHRRHLLASSVVSLAACGIAPLVKPWFEDANLKQTLVPAKPSDGFNFPYFLQLPSLEGVTAFPYLLVETNNTGPISGDVEPHLQPTSELARQGLGGRASVALGAPLLMPVFPREPNLYTHSLGRSTLTTGSEKLRRLDLQLLAMARDAQRLLKAQGRGIASKLFLTGFSASAMFATRFAALHPQDVAAVVAGGLNSFVILPFDSFLGNRLTYPLGIADLEQVAGQAFDRRAWQQVPQLLFMGALDTNDAVDFDDAYSSEHRRLIHQLLGRRMIPERWQACERVYRDAMAPARFRTFDNVGHGTTRLIRLDAVAFLKEIAAKPART